MAREEDVSKLREQIWGSVREIAQQLGAEHPDASGPELMKLLIQELKGRRDTPKTEPEAR
jgi:hypothetical protein